MADVGEGQKYADSEPVEELEMVEELEVDRLYMRLAWKGEEEVEEEELRRLR